MKYGRLARSLGFAALPLAVFASLWIVSAPNNDHTPPPPNFGGFLCHTAACVDHRAGYVWASHAQVRDASACTQTSRSFNEGCQAWVRNGPGLLPPSRAADAG